MQDIKKMFYVYQEIKVKIDPIILHYAPSRGIDFLLLH